MLFTGTSTVADVLGELRLQEDLDVILGGCEACGEQTKLYDIGNLCNSSDVKSVQGGLNLLLSAKERGEKVRYQVWDDAAIAEDPSKADVVLYRFRAAEKGPFAMICPGGAYQNVVSITEGFPVAAALNALGINAFVLRYRVAPNAGIPNPMDDLAHAIRLVMQHRNEWNVSHRNYSVWGFSAGGHLAASFGTSHMGFMRYGLRAPAALVLSYPVISMDEHMHTQSRDNLLTSSCDEDMMAFASVQRHVHRHYPPTYIWSCLNDDVVPFENSRLLKEKLSDIGIHHRLMSVPGTTHGLSLAVDTPAESWFAQAVAFWRSAMKR